MGVMKARTDRDVWPGDMVALRTRVMLCVWRSNDRMLCVVDTQLVNLVWTTTFVNRTELAGVWTWMP